MGLGTKNRQKQTADICKLHLREKYRDQRELVEEFIVEIEGAPKNCDVTRWAGSPISKTSKKRCSSAWRHISRSGSIRELYESIFAKLALAGFSEKPQIVNSPIFCGHFADLRLDLRALRSTGDVCYGKTPKTQVDLALSRTIANSHR